MKKLVIFDCDGVLINTEEIIEIAKRDVFAEYGMDFTLAEIRAHFSGLSYEDSMKKRAVLYFEKFGAPIPDSFQTRLDDLYHEREAQKIAAIDGIRGLLVSLRAAGIPVCVASNSRISALDRKLRQVGLHEFFAPHIYSREHVAEGKPAPDVYLYAARQMGVHPADCIVVEDSAPGVQAGVAAKMHVIGIARQKQALPADPVPLLLAGARNVVPSGRTLKAVIFQVLGKPPALAAPRP